VIIPLLPVPLHLPVAVAAQAEAAQPVIDILSGKINVPNWFWI
jgi:hypothetical protein